MALELKNTEHSYYCSDNNYYVGKGNEDWNCSAPHGAGRIMSRSKTKEVVSLEEFEDSMKGIYNFKASE
jgi:RNA-splicing ligase RtcB